MKLMHLADLHIGKRVNEFSMLEDQDHILKQVLDYAEAHSPHAMLLAGDIYDKTVPSAESVQLFDWFITALAEKGFPVFIISGNHDSAERIAFGARIMCTRGIHFSPLFCGTLSPVTLSDEEGEVCIWMLPFIKPAQVRACFPEATVESYEDAVRTVLEQAPVDRSRRNVLVAHQFVTGAGCEPVRSESENISVGGVDNVDISCFDAFDYVALGHLHGPQQVGRENIRYAGSPLKYSFSEVRQHKAVTLVELGSKGTVDVIQLPLTPLRDVREIRGPLRDLLSPTTWSGTNTDDYLHITLTDEDEILDAIGKVHTVYPNVMRLDYDNTRTRAAQGTGAASEISGKSHLELFRDFYLLQHGQELDVEKQATIETLLEKLGGEGT